MIKYFIENETLDWQQIDEKVSRKVMAYDSNLMLLKIKFEEGGIGPIHQHPHVQITHIESGIFEVEIGGEKKVLKGGDAFMIPSNIWHGVVCLEAGVFLDTFSPMREDFI